MRDTVGYGMDTEPSGTQMRQACESKTAFYAGGTGFLAAFGERDFAPDAHPPGGGESEHVEDANRRPTRFRVTRTWRLPDPPRGLGPDLPQTVMWAVRFRSVEGYIRIALLVDVGAESGAGALLLVWDPSAEAVSGSAGVLQPEATIDLKKAAMPVRERGIDAHSHEPRDCAVKWPRPQEELEVPVGAATSLRNPSVVYIAMFRSGVIVFRDYSAASGGFSLSAFSLQMKPQAFESLDGPRHEERKPDTAASLPHHVHNVGVFAANPVCAASDPQEQSGSESEELVLVNDVGCPWYGSTESFPRGVVGDGVLMFSATNATFSPLLHPPALHKLSVRSFAQDARNECIFYLLTQERNPLPTQLLRAELAAGQLQITHRTLLPERAENCRNAALAVDGGHGGADVFSSGVADEVFVTDRFADDGESVLYRYRFEGDAGSTGKAEEAELRQQWKLGRHARHTTVLPRVVPDGKTTKTVVSAQKNGRAVVIVTVGSGQDDEDEAGHKEVHDMPDEAFFILH